MFITVDPSRDDVAAVREYVKGTDLCIYLKELQPYFVEVHWCSGNIYQNIDQPGGDAELSP